jgi:uncharacterized protein
MAAVTDIFRYPVKSMQGERLATAQLGITGIPGDRAWALKDDVHGGLTGAKRFAALMSMRARFVREPDAADRSPPVQISPPDGQPLLSTDPDANRRLSALLDHPVSLWPLLPAEADAHYRRAPAGAGTSPEAALRAVFARTRDEPLPDVSKFPPVLFTHYSPPGTYFDAFPLLLLSRESLETMNRLAADMGLGQAFDVRRFRPNLLLETGGEGFPEQAWIGRRLGIGSAVFKVEMPCPRCIMTTHGFADLPRDPKIMRALVKHNAGELGVYASVVEPGEVAVGDEVEVR